MTTAAVPLKSILKNSNSTATSGSKAVKTATVRAPPSQSRSSASSNNLVGSTILVSQGKIGPNGRRLPTPEEARRIALYHANIIQTQKEFELSILNSIELLLDFPNTENHASKPSHTDIISFKKYLQNFRPSDYDDLIEERNIISKCGYALCPLPNKRQPTNAKYRVLDKGKRIVETKQLERFCGEDCARRGLWVRVQLSEEPSWLRVGPDGEVGKGGVETTITLWDEESNGRREDDTAFQGDVQRLADQLSTMGINGTNLPSPSSKPTPKSEITATIAKFSELVTITERPPSDATSPQPPTLPQFADGELAAKMAAMSVEGYIPSGKLQSSLKDSKGKTDDGEDDDE